MQAGWSHSLIWGVKVFQTSWSQWHTVTPTKLRASLEMLAKTKINNKNLKEIIDRWKKIREQKIKMKKK